VKNYSGKNSNYKKVVGFVPKKAQAIHPLSAEACAFNYFALLMSLQSQ